MTVKLHSEVTVVLSLASITLQKGESERLTELAMDILRSFTHSHTPKNLAGRAVSDLCFSPPPPENQTGEKISARGVRGSVAGNRSRLCHTSCFPNAGRGMAIQLSREMRPAMLFEQASKARRFSLLFQVDRGRHPLPCRLSIHRIGRRHLKHGGGIFLHYVRGMGC